MFYLIFVPRFPSPVLKIQYNPRVEPEILVTPMRHAAVVVTLTGNTQVTANSNGANSNYKLVPLDDENDPQIVATYDPRGKRIYTGNSRGKILIFSYTNKGEDRQFKIVSQFKVTQQASSTTAVKGIEFSRRGGSFLVNTADRVIRVYKTSDVLSLKDGK